MLGTNRDITYEVLSRQQLERAQVEVEDARAELKSVLDATPFFIVRVDSNERYIFHNKATFDHF